VQPAEPPEDLEIPLHAPVNHHKRTDPFVIPTDPYHPFVIPADPYHPFVIPTDPYHPFVIPSDPYHPFVIPTERSERRNLARQANRHAIPGSLDSASLRLSLGDALRRR
jgi:hypothetical protein